MTVTAPPQRASDEVQPARRDRIRITLAAVLVTLSAVATISAILSWWAGEALLDGDVLVEALAELPRDPEQAEALGTWLATETIEGLA